MPEGRPFPNKFLPRLDAHLSVTFGAPLPADEVRAAIADVAAGTLSQSTDTHLGQVQSNLGRDCKDIEAEVHAAVREAKSGMSSPSRMQEERVSVRRARERWLGDAVPDPKTMTSGRGMGNEEELARVRSAVTAVVQGYVERLGREVEDRKRIKA